tara:strand:- start:10650 stop:11057 length:408 start_codon:yes stop_codon:yes gene_type:complete
MSFESDLYSYLSTHADATALRAIVSTRIYWATTPQNPTYPYIQISTVSTEPQHTLGGDDGFTETRLQFSVFDRVHTVCLSVRDALRTLLHGNQRITEGSTTFQSILMGDVRELWEDDAPGGFMHMPIDFDFIHST